MHLAIKKKINNYALKASNCDNETNNYDSVITDKYNFKT
jgi:hypothetical protein